MNELEKLAELAENFPKEALGVCINAMGDYHFMPEGEEILSGYMFYSKAEVLAQKKGEAIRSDAALTDEGTKITELRSEIDQLREQNKSLLEDRALNQRKLQKVREANEQLAEACKENDALKAQVNELRDEIQLDVAVSWPSARVDKLKGLLEKSPAHCLVDVQAQAIEECALSAYEYTDSTNDACWAYTFDSETKRKMIRYAHKLKESANAE